MTTDNGAFSTASLELVKRELGGIREFYETRMNAEIPPLREEMERLGSQLAKLQDARRQGEKLALLNHHVGDRPRALFGKYAGMDHLDLACARSLLSAQLREPPAPARGCWRTGSPTSRPPWTPPPPGRATSWSTPRRPAPCGTTSTSRPPSRRCSTRCRCPATRFRSRCSLATSTGSPGPRTPPSPAAPRPRRARR